jgi:two-component system sensor histidine kinase KdpD
VGLTNTTRAKAIEPYARDPLTGERISKKGYLKIFLGYASGVGKSFRMLDEARRRHERGQDVVVGAIQPKLPSTTQELLSKLEVIPLKQLLEGTAIDVEALLRRNPEVCFIDGLAYDNPPGSRNATRWQDVQELVSSGIKVVASVNIQYIEELREQVEGITGKHVTQVVPISFIKSADEIEIVDAPPVELRGDSTEERAGLEQRQRQLSRLREMALVLAADVVDHQLTQYLNSHGIKQLFGTLERVLVCISPRANAKAMLATGHLIAKRFYGELIAVHVDQPQMSSADRAAVNDKLALARSINARVEILHGSDPIESILDFARARGITEIFVGHSHRSSLWSRLFGNRVDKIIRLSRGMDVRIFPNEK